MISILITSVRDSIYRVVDHIEKTLSSVDYEIVICSDNDLSLNKPNIKLIKDRDGNIGSITPTNQCLKESQGEYFLVTCDDILLNPNVVHLEEFLKSDTFKNRQHEICSIGYTDYHHCFVPTFNRYRPSNIPIMSFPAGSRWSIEDNMGGVIFNEGFRHIWADNWLSYYLAKKGEHPIFMPYTHNDLSFDTREEKSKIVRQSDEEYFKKLIDFCDDNSNISYNHQLAGESQ
jgi:glycosyltransferase involved in cell wall biosynthesis